MTTETQPSYAEANLAEAAQAPAAVKLLRGFRLYFLGPALYLLASALSGSLLVGFAVGMVVMFTSHAALELKAPYLAGLHRGWLSYLKDFAQKSKLSLVMTLSGLFGGFYLVSSAREALGVGWNIMSALEGTTANWGWAAALPVAAAIMVCGDFFVYWYHRTVHSLGDSPLWELHRTHHGIPVFTAANGATAHPLETVVTYFWYGQAAGALGASVEATFLAGSLIIFFMSAHHVNADTSIGPLRWLLVTTDVHRWHHNIEHEKSGNFSLLLTVWDLAFGTYNHPHKFRGSMGIHD